MSCYSSAAPPVYCDGPSEMTGLMTRTYVVSGGGGGWGRVRLGHIGSAGAERAAAREGD